MGAQRESDWMHAGPSYEPPYESPLEHLFALNAIKYLKRSINFQKQVEVKTICGRFRMDFVADTGSKRVAFECDGSEYHNPSRDEWRDAMILGAGAVDVIYRLRGSDLTYHLEDCLFLASQWDPEIFSERGLINLERLASDEVRSYKLRKDDTMVMIEYRPQSEGIPPFYIFVERRSREIPHGQRAFWKHVFDWARKRGGGNLDQLIKEYRSEKLEQLEGNTSADVD